jgi:hypothetical protein
MISLGSIASDAVPSLAVAREDLDWFDLAQPVRELLARVDGHETIATICERCGLELDRGMGAIHDLARDGIVTLRR